MSGRSGTTGSGEELRGLPCRENSERATPSSRGVRDDAAAGSPDHRTVRETEPNDTQQALVCQRSSANIGRPWAATLCPARSAWTVTTSVCLPDDHGELL